MSHPPEISPTPVHAAKVTVADLDRLATEIFTLKSKAEVQEEALTATNKELGRAEQKCIEILKELGLETFKGSLGQVTPMQVESYPTPKDPDDRALFFNHLRERNLFDSMITVNYQTLNSWAKEEYQQAKDRGDIFFTIPGLSAPTIAHRLRKTPARI